MNRMTIIYKINNNEKRIKIFGKEFVEKNSDNCKLIINNKEEELKYNYDISDNREILEIKLKEIKSIINMSYMFSDCILLEYIIRIIT